MKTSSLITPVSHCIALFVLFLFSTFANAAILKVGHSLDPNVPNQFNTISAALSVASTNDLILIGSGTYVGDITANTSNLTIKGAGIGLTEIVGRVTLLAGTTIMNLTVDSITFNAPSSRIFNIHLRGNLSLRRNDTEVVNSKIDGELFLGNSGSFSTDNALVVGNIFASYIAGSNHNTNTGSAENVKIIGNVFYIDTQSSSSTIFRNIGGISSGAMKNNLIIRNDENTHQSYIPLESNCNNNSFEISNNTFTMPPIDALDQPICSFWKNNIFTYPVTPTVDANGNVYGDVNFVDEANGDYNLANGSIGINAGIGLDADGSQADAGAFGSTGASVWNSTTSTAGKPSIGPILVQPDPIGPGESIRIQFNAETN